jgi:hypothetical protein
VSERMSNNPSPIIIFYFITITNSCQLKLSNSIVYDTCYRIIIKVFLLKSNCS